MIITILLQIFSLSYAGCNELRIKNLSDVDVSKDKSEIFQVRRNGSDGCNFFITINNGRSQSYTKRAIYNNTDSIPVQICSDGNCGSIIKSFPEITSDADILVGSFPANNRQPSNSNFTIYFTQDPNLYSYHGNYDDTFEVQLYEGVFNGSHTLIEKENLKLKSKISKRIDLSLVDSGAAFDINSTNKSLNFGSLQQGKQLGFDLMLKYNAGYRVKVSSENNGSLKHISQSDLIQYSFTLNSIPLSLSNSNNQPITVVEGGGISPPTGSRLPGRITIGSVNNAQSGNYQDRITISVATTE